MTEEQVKGLLSLGRVESQPRVTADLCRLLGDVALLVSPSCRHAGVTLRREQDEGLAAAPVDEAGLRGAVLNLVLNAIEAAGPGGEVTLGTSTRSGSVVVIEVADNGPGPPPRLASTLFDPFVTSKPEGVGLGLALARQVAVDHGGDLSWTRADDRTIFRLTIPDNARVSEDTR